MLNRFGVKAVLKKLSQWLIALRTLQLGVTNNKQKQIGDHGERIACSYLKKKGWNIVATTLRYGKDELDILGIPPNENTLAVVEVRSTSRQLGNPESTMTHGKRKSMARIARKVRGEALKYNCELRFDLITVRLFHKKPHIRHYEGILRKGI